MSDLGNFSLLMSWVLSAYIFTGGLYAALFGRREWLKSVLNAGLCCGILLLISLLALSVEFLLDDFSNQYVWRYSLRELPIAYKVSAVWAGMEGSFLLWTAFLGVVLLSVARGFYPKKGKLGLTTEDLEERRGLDAPWIISVMGSVLVFFTSVVLFQTNPFRCLKTDFLPLDGNGLNPLLQNPFMVLHPPFLYAGFSILVMPFVFYLAARLAGLSSEGLLGNIRRWTLAGWILLTAGISLGAYWAYIELGWGGFWAWDPVENVSLIPWLLCTALLHSLVVQKRTGTFIGLNAFLSAMVWGSVIFGAFIARSGVLQSVHAFTEAGAARMLLAYLALLVVVYLVFFVWRKGASVSPAWSFLAFSKESLILYGVIILCCIGLVVLWGTLFPVLSEVFLGEKRIVAASYYNAASTPLFLIILCLMVPGLFVSWGGRGLTTEGSEVHRGGDSQVSQRLSLPCRFSFLLHFGFVIMAIGVAASMSGKQEKEFFLEKGEHFIMGKYQLSLDEISQRKEQGYEAIAARLLVRENEGRESKGMLSPELRYYPGAQMTASEVAILSELQNDLYVAFLGLDEAGKTATFRAYLNPLQAWVWIGVFVMIFAAALRMAYRFGA